MKAKLVGLALLLSFVLVSEIGTTPPVRRNDEFAGMAQAARANPDFTWNTLDGVLCRIHYQPDTFASKHVVMLLRSAERSIEDGLVFLEAPDYKRRIEVFYINSREEMKKLVGMGATGYADAESNSVYLVCNDGWRSFDQHEIMHVLSLNIWGNPQKPVEWIREGLAVYVDGRCGQHSINELVHHLLREDKLPPLKTVIHSFYEQNDLLAYLQCGSMIGYIYDKHGLEGIKKLWDGGVDSIQDSLGMTLEEFENSWRSHVLKSIPGENEVDWESIEDPGCG
jgi:hypothetical protein